ncbi:dihydrofolate reductase [Candidatus Berkelbacteria bacterium]|nr:dihydrofolate reductase [Candidatus Berkelbacteria bacterium]
MNPIISLIAVIDEGRAIGKDNKLIWDLPSDLKRFKQITTGHPIVMGRKTFESIGRPLPNRTNIIITRDQRYTAAGCVVVHSLDEALTKARAIEQNEIFVIGGGQIFEQVIGKANKLYLTIVKGRHDADSFFPDYSAFTKVLNQESGSENGLSFTYLELARG